jgi:ABC-type glycerol-3-phosphate transport system permease component
MEPKITISRTKFVIRGFLLGVQAAFFGSIVYGFLDAFSLNLRASIIGEDYFHLNYFDIFTTSARAAFLMIWMASLYTLIISFLPTVIGGVISAVCVYCISQKGNINRKRIIRIGAMGGLLFGAAVCVGFALLSRDHELISFMIYDYVLGVLAAMLCGGWVASNLVKDVEKNIRDQLQDSEAGKARDLFPIG